MSKWLRGTIGELAKGHRGVSYTAGQLCQFKSQDTVTLLRSNNINSGRLNYDDTQIVPKSLVSLGQYLRQGDIAVCMSNGSKALVGKAAPFLGSNSEYFTVGAFCSVFRPIEGSVPAFVSFLFQSQEYRKNLDLALAGTAINNLRNIDIEAFKCDIPPPSEQSQIAQVLNTLDTAINETEAIIAKLKAVKQGLLHDLLTRGIDANGQLRPTQTEAPHLYKDSPLGWIPKSWGVGTIANYLDGEQQGIKPGPFGSSIKKEAYSEIGFKVYGQEQVIAGDQNIGNYFVPLRKYQELQDFAVEAGDVLISLVGTIGKVLVIKAPFTPGLINPRLMRLRPDLRIAEPEFTAFLISSDSFVRQVIANAGGGTMPVINKRIISSIHVPVVPLDEQQEILKRKTSVEQSIHLESAALEKLKTQKSGLMDDLLTGRVRVTPLLNTNNEQGAS